MGFQCLFNLSFEGWNNNNQMLANPSGKFETLVTNLLIDRKYEKALEISLKLYQIKQYNVSKLTPQKIVEMYYVITTKFYYNRVPGNIQSWYENELRVFIWLLAGYSYLESKCISNMSLVDWKFFSDIFNERSPDIFEFQALTILKKEHKCTKWQIDEVSLLDSIIKAKSIKNKWNEIAKELFIRSEKRFFRTAKQCRQYWINHLDPVPVRSSWTATDDFELIKAVKILGKKWSKVSKSLGGRRTEHMVKNRFLSLQRFEVKNREYQNDEANVNVCIIDKMIQKAKINIEEEQKLQIYRASLQDNGSEEEARFKIRSAEVLDDEQEYYESDGSKEEQKVRKFLEKGSKEGHPNRKCEANGHLQEFIQENCHPSGLIVKQFSLEDCFNVFFNESCLFKEDDPENL